MQDRFKELVELGLTEDEAELLMTPLHQITDAEGLAALDMVWLMRNELVWAVNASFVSERKNVQVMKSRDNFEPFQSPCNTDIIITSERERQEDMKRNGCFDAREMIPHGKTSLLEAKL